MSDRKPTSVVLLAVIALMVLLGIYVGAYYATVNRTWPGPTVFGTAPHYGWPFRNSQTAKDFFLPAHNVDRRIRAAYWNRTMPK